jgi:hypothetical protein
MGRRQAKEKRELMLRFGRNKKRWRGDENRRFLKEECMRDSSNMTWRRAFFRQQRKC